MLTVRHVLDLVETDPLQRFIRAVTIASKTGGETTLYQELDVFARAEDRIYRAIANFYERHQFLIGTGGHITDPSVPKDPLDWELDSIAQRETTEAVKFLQASGVY